MKKRKLILALLVPIVLLCTGKIQAHAQTRASQYINNYVVSAAQGSNRGEVNIDFSIQANTVVSKIGALKIEIYRSNGGLVTTLYGSPSNGLLSPRNSIIYGISYHYKGISGTSYYAIVTLCAGTSSDYDTRVVRTQTVKAPY